MDKSPRSCSANRKQPTACRAKQIEVVWELVRDQDAEDALLRVFEMIFAEDTGCPPFDSDLTKRDSKQIN